MFRRLLVIVFACSLLSCAKAEFSFETIAEDLNYPWSLAFLADGSMLVTERAGQLRVIRNGSLVAEPVAGVPEAYVAGQGGMFEILPDPNYAENKTIYLSFAYGDKKDNATRVVRARFDGKQLNDVETIFTATPMKDTVHHFGARMAFLPDGTLLITVGEGSRYREEAQKPENHLGSIVRIKTDGSIPADNPYVGDARVQPETWSWGHRNPQGIVVLPGTDTVYEHEHGPRGGDELNLIEPGKNYGWPAITHGIDYSGAQISPYKELPGMEQPVVYWVPSIAPSGMSYYDGELFPEWRGDLFISALAEKSVRRLHLEEGVVVSQEVLFEDLGQRIRDVRSGPDGALYLLTDSSQGKVLKVTPAQ